MAEAVYALCALTALTCALMLMRSFNRTRSRLILWSSLCFAALTLNNVLLYVDLVLVPSIDLSILRSAIALGGLGMLLYGLIWEDR